MQNKNLAGFMPLIHLLWSLDKYLLGSGHAAALVVVDNTPAMAAKIAMSDGTVRTKVGFWLFQQSSKRTLRMPLEVLWGMQSSCGTCWRLIRRSREQQLQLGILKNSASAWHSTVDSGQQLRK